MRKLFAIAFTCVYLTLTVGVVHATHYCMGRVKSSTFFSFESEKCACASLTAQFEKSCCDDKVTLVKIDEDQSLSSPLSITPEFFSMWENHLPQAVEQSAGSDLSFLAAHSGPPGSQVPLFVQHCSLIFYSEPDLA